MLFLEYFINLKKDLWCIFEWINDEKKIFVLNKILKYSHWKLIHFDLKYLSEVKEL